MKILVVGIGGNWESEKADLMKNGDEVIGLDIIPEFKPEIVRDILRGLPFDSDSIDKIICQHVLEHISGHLACKPTDNFDFVMNEFNRVLKTGGELHIEVPYWRDDIAVEASGHSRFFAEHSFLNYYENPCWQQMGQCYFSKVLYKNIAESGRSSITPSRVLQIGLTK